MTGAAALLFADGDPEMAALMPEIMGNLFVTDGAGPLMEPAFAGADLSLEAVALGNQTRYALNQELARAFDDADLILTPTSPVPAFGCAGPLPTVVDGRDVGPQACALFTSPFNISGHPVVSVPMGLVDGAPVGMQIVARRHEDALALAAAAAFEAARPWPLLAPDLVRCLTCGPVTTRPPGPDHLALIMAGSGETLTYRELDERSNQLAQLFAAAGLGFGDHVAFYLENHPRYLEILWAAQRSGIVYTAISSQLTADEVAYLIEDCGAKALITSRAKAEVAAALVDRMPAVTTRLMLDGAIAGYDAYEEAVAAFPATPIAEELEGTAMLYSSGTTGQPKGIRYSLERTPIGSAPFAVDMFKAVYGIDDTTCSSPPRRCTTRRRCSSR